MNHLGHTMKGISAGTRFRGTSQPFGGPPRTPAHGLRDAAISYSSIGNPDPARNDSSSTAASLSTFRARGSIEGISTDEILPGSALRQPFCYIRIIAFRYETSLIAPSARARNSSAAKLTPPHSFNSARCAQALPAVEAGSDAAISSAGIRNSDANRLACSSATFPPGSASWCMIRWPPVSGRRNEGRKGPGRRRGGLCRGRWRRTGNRR